ncbi:MAG: glycosyltransferase family 39 protein [Ignavibacteriaceae bacterium]|nr:glycosyltransferase family 39 protein [Ignavibacteriaceae bacterium]
MFNIDFSFLVAFMPDDAFYYQQIAYNFNRGLGFSFDGLNQTNGYQPIWMYILTGIYAIFDFPKEMMIRITLFIQLIIIVLTLYFFYDTLKQIINNSVVRYSAFSILFFLLFFRSLGGMDTAILILFYAILLKLFINRKKFAELTYTILAAVLTGVIILTRLDQAPLALIIPLLLFERKDKFKVNTKSLMIYWGISGAIIAPYLAGNLLQWGHLMPVSVWIKSSFPNIILHSTTFKAMSENITVVLSAVLILIYPVWLLIAKIINYTPESPALRKFTILIWVTVIIHFFHLILFLTFGFAPWHISMYLFAISLIIIEPVHYFLKSKKFVYITVIALITINLYSGYKFWNKYYEAPLGKWGVINYTIAQHQNKTLPEDARVFYSDCGVFGFFSERNTINADGLVNNYEYQTVLKEQRLKEYLIKNKISHILLELSDNFVFEEIGREHQASFRFFSHKYQVLSDEFTIYLKDLLYLSSPRYDNEIISRYLIFKVNLGE